MNMIRKTRWWLYGVWLSLTLKYRCQRRWKEFVIEYEQSTSDYRKLRCYINMLYDTDCMIYNVDGRGLFILDHDGIWI